MKVICPSISEQGSRESIFVKLGAHIADEEKNIENPVAGKLNYTTG